MLDTDDDLPTLVRRRDHPNVLRYLRVHQIRDPSLVVATGRAWLGDALDRAPRGWGAAASSSEPARSAALEQICLAALDLGDAPLADLCLRRLRERPPSGAGAASAVVDPDASARFRLLQGRRLEAAADYGGAAALYDELLRENPSNLQALRRKYCLLKAQLGSGASTPTDVADALNAYLEQNPSDAAGWYELAHLRQEWGDYDGAAFGLEEVLLAAPTDAKIHVELAECLVTAATASSSGRGSRAAGRLETLRRARQHLAQALELDPTNRRAQFGLVVASNACLAAAEQAASSTKGEGDDHDLAVAQELVRYGAEQVLESYQGTPLFPQVHRLMDEYTGSLE